MGLPAGCSDPCCTTDGFPINLAAPVPLAVETGGPLAKARYPDGTPFDMSIDTGSSLTLFRRHAERNERAQMVTRDFDLLDALPAPDGTTTAVRAKFRGIEVLPLDLDPAGPEAVLGGTFLKNFSVQIDFGAPSITFWSRQGATDGLLASSGFAVLHFDLFGGGELTALSRPDFLGLTGPVEVPPTRVVLRGCGAPDAFDRVAPLPQICCKRGDEVLQASGVDLALVLATGVGPLVLSRSAWNRIVARTQNTPGGSPPPEPVSGAALPIPSLPAPLADVLWSTLPRLALVDQETDDSTNPGPCVELGRARRLEWMEAHQTDASPPCPQLCDTDPRAAGKAQNAAAYLEIGDNVPVAIVPDGTPLLQALRGEIRPEGPEIDGLVGAGVLARTTLEIDYKSQPSRALLTCAKQWPRTACLASPRCPRLSNPGDMRSCFGLQRQALPAACMKAVCE